jgi:hypothetical protein
VVAVRTFWNQAEAALDKSRLHDYGVFCALVHENAHLYGGAPLAMPIRLLVDDDEAEWAIAVLSGDLEGAVTIENSTETAVGHDDTSALPGFDRDNPWELLVIGFYLLLPGLTVLQTTYPDILLTDQRASRAIAAVALMHLFGWLGISAAVALAITYACVKRSSVTRHKHAS